MICPKLKEIFKDIRKQILDASRVEVTSDDVLIYLIKNIGNDNSFNHWKPHLALIANDYQSRMEEINRQQKMDLDKGQSIRPVFSLVLQNNIAEILLKTPKLNANLLLDQLLKCNDFLRDSLNKIDFPIAKLKEEKVDLENIGSKNVTPKFLIDMNEKAKKKEYDPLYGRDDELNELIEILLRRKKSNPLLLGDTGVGKTAIVEGLANAIESGSICSPLKNARIFSLSLTNLMAGTRFRGDLEEKLDAMIAILQSIEGAILFIDELHTVMGTGAGGGALDTANMLKPYLARGDIRCIAATTRDEFDKFIVNDKALVRRFTIINVKPLSEADVIMVLKAIKTRYEKYHKVTYDEAIFPEIVKACMQYFPYKPLPDMAIDIMDMLGARMKIKSVSYVPIDLEFLNSYISSIIEKV